MKFTISNGWLIYDHRRLRLSAVESYGVYGHEVILYIAGEDYAFCGYTGHPGEECAAMMALLDAHFSVSVPSVPPSVPSVTKS
jgi:hypothetical protein